MLRTCGPACRDTRLSSDGPAAAGRVAYVAEVRYALSQSVPIRSGAHLATLAGAAAATFSGKNGRISFSQFAEQLPNALNVFTVTPFGTGLTLATPFGPEVFTRSVTSHPTVSAWRLRPAAQGPISRSGRSARTAPTRVSSPTARTACMTRRGRPTGGCWLSTRTSDRARALPDRGPNPARATPQHGRSSAPGDARNRRRL